MGATTARVGTSYGQLQGTVEHGMCVFRGIPFAKPPLGPLRFCPPERPLAWNGVRDATRFGPGAHQANRPLAPLLGILVDEQSEDCLTLNIWTPATGGSASRCSCPFDQGQKKRGIQGVEADTFKLVGAPGDVDHPNLHLGREAVHAAMHIGQVFDAANASHKASAGPQPGIREFHQSA